MQGDNSAIEPDRIYTLDEAAAHLRLTKRAVAKLARKYGYCLVFGRTILLKGSDIEAIKDTMRVEAKAPRPAPGKPYRSEFQTRERLMELVTKRPKKPGRIHWEETNAANAAEREATKSALAASADETLDRKNRDPAYWTPKRKERLRLESLARRKGWSTS